MTKIDEERLGRIEAFREAMVAKLNVRRNVAKSDWRDMDPLELVSRIEDEVVELREEAGECYSYIGRSRDRLLGECLDIANFAFMLWEMVERTEPKEGGK